MNHPGARGIGEFASSEVYAAIGIGPALFGASAGGGVAREAYRLFLHTVLTPLSKIVENELSRKLGGQVEFSFSALAASDVTAKSRAYASLTSSPGIDPAEAKKIVGFD